MIEPHLALSIVSPVYQSAGTVDELVRRIVVGVQAVTLNFEIVLVDDRSDDESWARIVQAARENGRVRGARLSKNFGQHAAITAALKLARGDRVIVMDCDLQHDPAELKRLWIKADEGFDIVLAHHDERRHSVHRNLGAAIYRVLNAFISGNEQAETGFGTYSLLSRKVVDAFLQFPEVHRHYLQIILWMGFSVARVEVDHQPRFDGASSYTFKKLVKHAIHGTLSQWQRLLYISTALGVCYCVAAGLGVCYVVTRWAIWGLKEGWASMVVLILASTGSILFTLGILGLYIGAIFEQVRSRPIFLVDETTVSIS
jgi:glycosyltransferase involved in cell wall biosynthesis